MNEQDKARLIQVNWDTPKSGHTYFVDIVLEGNDRKGLFSDISKACDDNDVTLAGVNMRPITTGDVNLTITVSIEDMHQLQRVLISLRQIPSITSVYRAKGN